MRKGIIIFESDTAIRKVFDSLLLEMEEYELTGHYKSCKDIFAITHIKQPAIILLDLDMQTKDIITNIQQIKNASPDTSIISFSSVEEDDKIFLCLCAGANGHLNKSTTPDALNSAIKMVLDGGAPMSQTLAIKLFNSFQDANKKNSYKLSHHEHCILKLLSRGHRSKQIAEELNMAIGSVRVHIKNIYLKLQVTSAKEAIARAIEEKII